MGTPLRIVVVTGLSGGGKSTALGILQDLGYFCVDNLPTPLATELARMAATGGEIERVALGVDARGRVFGRSSGSLPEELRQAGHQVTVLFLDASDDCLRRRFSESRRPHPLAVGGDVLGGIAEERRTLSALRAQADDVVDTTHLTVHGLRRALTAHFGPEGQGREMAVRIVSFGFRHGLPADADLVFDVRFLPNPFFVPELKPLSGLDEGVAAFVLGAEETREFLDKTAELLDFLLPLYRREGKSYLTVALGCTGGRHRSVALAAALSQRLSVGRPPVVLHRDVNHNRGENVAPQDVSA